MVMFAIEAALVLAALAVAIAYPGLGAGFAQRVEARLGRLARSRAKAVLAVGLLALAAQAVRLVFVGIPEPTIHDEFSFLLAADTFSHFRLTNPTHPMWVHFETFHVTQQPTYMSMYPPLEGLALAAGQIVFGHPWYAVAISMALMCAAITWALQVWLPPGWALLGGFYALLRLGLFTYWVDGYFAAALPALGGALVLGAMGGLLRKPSAAGGSILAIGMMMMANSRPYEGLALSVGAGAVLLWKWLRAGPEWRSSLTRAAAVPCLAILAIGAAGMAYYNYRLFGNPLTLPYTIDRAQYAVAPYFVWEKAPAPSEYPEYRHQAIKDYYVDYELGKFMVTRGLHGFPIRVVAAGVVFWRFFLGFFFTVPLLLTIPWLLKGSGIRIPLILLGFSAGCVLLVAFSFPHYFAVATAPLYVVLTQSMRHVRAGFLRRRHSGVALVRNLFVVCLLLTVIRPFVNVESVGEATTWFTPHFEISGREAMIEHLEEMGGKHLVLVRYTPDHNPAAEWVYNLADIDRSPVVWARDMDGGRNRELLQYFPDRQAWLLEPDLSPPRLTPYPISSKDGSGKPKRISGGGMK